MAAKKDLIMQPTIALCQSGVKVKNAPLTNITLSELTTQLKNPVTGDKDGSYFLIADLNRWNTAVKYSTTF